ncbi:GNAT family N-acetyltransferase [soil metagenome]
MNILETERLFVRELDSSIDAEFVFELLNTPKFLSFIGDRGVRSVDEAAIFIDERYRASYTEHGYGLYTVELKENATQVGLCGFVRRDTLPGPDIGFAFLPEFERQGYGFESAEAMMKYGSETLNFTTVLAITSLENDASGKLLEKLGFTFKDMIENDEEKLRLYSSKS